MTAAIPGPGITPCPPWCRTDHDRYSNHGQLIGAVGAMQVFAYEDESGKCPPNVSLVDQGRAPALEIQVPQVSDLVALLTRAAALIEHGEAASDG